MDPTWNVDLKDYFEVGNKTFSWQQIFEVATSIVDGFLSKVKSENSFSTLS